jgi:hypothetical protein
MPSLAQEFNISLSTVHGYIEEQRKLLRAQTIDLAAQERDQALELLDNAIEQVVPHINGQVIIETEVHRVIKGQPQTFKMTIEEWQARMKGCAVLVQLLDRKAKLLGMDAPIKTELPPNVARRPKSNAPAPALRSDSGRSSVLTLRISRARTYHDHDRAAKGSSLL